MYWRNYGTGRFFLEDYGIWKFKFFIFEIVVFSNLDAFPDKIYEKTCAFYNIFSNLISNCTRLTSFTIWIAFRKKIEIVSTQYSFFLFWTIFLVNIMRRLLFCYRFSIFLSYSTCSGNFVIWNILQKYFAPYWKC